MRTDIEALVARQGMQDSVRITGWIGSEQVREETLQARVLVLPSFAEGLSVVIMEAMSLGRPLVSTTVAGIPELVRQGVDGWLVAPGDVGALTECLTQVLAADIILVQEMGPQGRRRVKVRHNIDVKAAKLRTLFLGSA